jgi:hypothetical protein
MHGREIHFQQSAIVLPDAALESDLTPELDKLKSPQASPAAGPSEVRVAVRT